MNKIILFFLLLPLTGFCQVTDDFTDGDFTSDPTWAGSDTNFIVTLEQLQSKGPHYNGNTIDDTIYLSTPNTLISSTEWRFLIDLKFNPTSDNLVKVFFVSGTSDLKYNLNGYYIEIGQTSADNIKFYRQDGASSSLLFTGTSSFPSNIKVGIKVTRDASGNWQVFSDPGGGINYISEGSSFLDNTYSATSFFGIYCRYKTDTRYNQYYFDDFYIGPIIADTIPPVINSLIVVSPTQLDLTFSENVNIPTAENINNYSVNNSVGNPSSAVRDGFNNALVHLTLSSALTQATIYTLTTNNVQDLSNNTMTPDSRVFALYTPKAYDVLINEIFPDPDPQVGLPDYEYVELYNRTPYSLNLKNWELTVGTSVKVFPSVVIEPDSFLILTSTSAVSSFITYGQVAGFSSFSLTNTGATLILSDSLGHIIHAITYSDTWYQDAGKANGGWSIELIDPANPCGDAANWIASVDPAGGTPGKKNSVFSSNPDNIPPQLSNINVISASCIQLNFSEPLDSASLVNPALYSIDNGIGIPAAVNLVKPDYKKVILYLGSALQQNILYTCTVTGDISDCAGNTTIAMSSTFSLYDAKQFDVVINEIMADPDPPVGLANYEYVELYNRTIYPISMSGWKFQMGTTIKTIPDATINPHAYLLLTTTDGETSISSYGNAIGVTGFAISNTGETLSLYDSLYRIISTVSFTDAWYHDSYKMNGGWSLEQIDPMNPCGDASNWRASNNMLGGTPGMVNSINASSPDNTAPQLVRVSLINNNSIQLYFTESLDSTYLQNISNYTIDNGIGNPATASPVSPDYRSVVLDISPAVQTGIVYTITITDTLKDCVGNVLPVNSYARFAIPELPIANDLVINEVLSDPKDNGVDYVELYNRSNKVIDLKQLVLASYDTITLTLTDVNNISVDGYLVFPEDYVVLTTDPVIVTKQYNTPNPNGVAQMPSLPSLNNDDGAVALSLKNLITIIDKFAYTADMYYPLLNSTDGVSLERINFNRPADDKTNWHSAAETAGFGTPAYKNSQYSEGVASEDPVSVSPEIFSPDNDGINDVLNINYEFDVAGYTANINVYDANGRLIRNLVKNELLGTSGNFSWNGITSDNEKARIGIYIIYFEVFDMNGNVKHYKESAVLASKL